MPMHMAACQHRLEQIFPSCCWAMCRPGKVKPGVDKVEEAIVNHIKEQPPHALAYFVPYLSGPCGQNSRGTYANARGLHAAPPIGRFAHCLSGPHGPDNYGGNYANAWGSMWPRQVGDKYANACGCMQPHALAYSPLMSGPHRPDK